MKSIPWNALKTAALRARENAYAPYSKFRVGAALLGKDGTIFVGTNVENASYGATICAERSAIMAAVAQGTRVFRAAVVIVDAKKPASPCGLCRQVLSEFPPSFPVRSYNLKGAMLSTRVSSLLPAAFGPANLKTKP